MSPSVFIRDVKYLKSMRGGFSGARNSKMTFILVSGDRGRKWSFFVVSRFSLDSRLYEVADHEYDEDFDVR